MGKVREGLHLGAPSERSLSKLFSSILLGFRGFGGVLSCFAKWDLREGPNFGAGIGVTTIPTWDLSDPLSLFSYDDHTRAG